MVVLMVVLFLQSWCILVGFLPGDLHCFRTRYAVQPMPLAILLRCTVAIRSRFFLPGTTTLSSENPTPGIARVHAFLLERPTPRASSCSCH
uniref:Putative secreted protein n=1 Tax=Anopheles triannulatus TaxID=58253 RepID=A0A2M4B1R2_9DIPT